MSLSTVLAKASIRQQWCLAAVVILGTGFITRFAYYGSPVDSMIDEVIFARYFSSYFTGLHYFDSHPPLGKLMVAGVVSLFDFKPVAFSTPWDTVLPSESYIAMRFLPKLFGAVLPFLVFVLVWKLFARISIAFIVGLFVVFDTAIMTQSRFMFWDVYMLCFGTGSLIAYFYYRKSSSWGSLLLCALLAGLACSIKWTGFTYIALLLGLEAYRVLFERYRPESMLKGVSVIASVAFMVYISTFAIHFSLLPKSGSGDVFMSENFQKTLEGSRYENSDIPPASFVRAFTDVNKAMYDSNKRTGSEHPYGSTWLDWPIGEKAMLYYYKDGIRIDLAANKVVWWIGSVSMVLCVLILLSSPLKHIRDITLIMIGVGYLGNWLPFAGIERVMFIHSYFNALLFSLLGFGYVLSRFPNIITWSGLLLLPVIGYFLYLVPMSYGL